MPATHNVAQRLTDYARSKGLDITVRKAFGGATHPYIATLPDGDTFGILSERDGLSKLGRIVAKSNPGKKRRKRKQPPPPRERLELSYKAYPEAQIQNLPKRIEAYVDREWQGNAAMKVEQEILDYASGTKTGDPGQFMKEVLVGLGIMRPDYWDGMEPFKPSFRIVSNPARASDSGITEALARAIERYGAASDIEVSPKYVNGKQGVMVQSRYNPGKYVTMDIDTTKKAIHALNASTIPSHREKELQSGLREDRVWHLVGAVHPKRREPIRKPGDLYVRVDDFTEFEVSGFGGQIIAERYMNSIGLTELPIQDHTGEFTGSVLIPRVDSRVR